MQRLVSDTIDDEDVDGDVDGAIRGGGDDASALLDEELAVLDVNKVHNDPGQYAHLHQSQHHHEHQINSNLPVDEWNSLVDTGGQHTISESDEESLLDHIFQP